MDSRRGTARTYEDFDPVVEWKVGDHGQDIVEITLQGFRKEHVRVQVDSQGVLRATGERPARGSKWVRFTKDLRLPDNCDADGVRAKFEDEKLIITLPIVSPDGELPPATSPVHETPPSLPEQDTIVTPEPSASPEPKPSPPHKETPATDVPETEMWGTEIGVSPPSPPPPPPHPPIEKEETKKEDHPPIEQEETKKEDHPPIEQEETKKEDSKVQEKVDKEDDMEPPTVIEPPMVATAKTMRALLVNMAAAVVVLVGIALSAWHTLRSKQD